MKSYYKDFCFDGVINTDEITEVINFRQSLFENTETRKKYNDKVRDLIKELGEYIPEKDKKVLLDLDAAISYLEMVNFEAAYRDGMADLMTSMSFNKAQITKAKYCELE